MSGATLWARNDIRRGWTSLLIVALLVAIAGGSVMAGVAGARRAGASVDRFLADSGFSDVTIYTESPLDPALHAELESDPRITDVADMRVVLATPTTVSPGLEGVTMVVPDEYFGDLVRPRLVRGTYPSGPDEIAMTEQAAALGFEVGQRVEMILLTPAGLESCIVGGECLPEGAGTVTITATVRGPSDLAPDAFGQGVFLAPAAFLECARRRCERHGSHHRHLPHTRHGDRRRHQRLLDEDQQWRRRQHVRRCHGRPSGRRRATRRTADRHGDCSGRRTPHRRPGLRQVLVTTVVGRGDAGGPGNAVGSADDGWSDTGARRRSTRCSAHRADRRRIVTIVSAAHRTARRP